MLEKSLEFTFSNAPGKTVTMNGTRYQSMFIIFLLTLNGCFRLEQEVFQVDVVTCYTANFDESINFREGPISYRPDSYDLTHLHFFPASCVK